MRTLLIAGSLIASIAGAHAQSAGDWVLARHKNGNYWFPGVVKSVSGDRVTIEYDDGDRETLYANAVRPYNWEVGTKIQCNFRGKGEWFSGRITALKDESVSVHYDDGDRENTKTGRCRSS